VDVRLATPADAEAIERIRVRGWQAAYRDVFPAAELDAMEVDWSRWHDYLAGDWEQTCFVCAGDGGVLGWVTVGASDDPGLGELHGLYVDPDEWSRGIGSTLIARAEAELARTWVDAILWTLEDNPRTRRFYEHAGWKADSMRSSFARFGVEAALVRYRKRLRRSTSRR
jgi:GNAT superfamily N-acetyltransferase